MEAVPSDPSLSHDRIQEAEIGLIPGSKTPLPPEYNNEGDGNQFQKAIAAWRNVGLGARLPELDRAASEIVSYQRDSLVHRKDLAQKTKDFRKEEDAAKLVDIKGLLKSYQAFIDLLTNQSKSTSSAFLQLYSALSEAPDPHPLLEASVEALAVSEDTVPRLVEENQRLQETMSRLSAQLEEAEEGLRQERSARQSLQHDLDAKVKAVEDSWLAVLAEKTDNWEAKETSLEEKVERQEWLIKELKANYEVSQRLNRAESDSNDDVVRGNAASAELEILSSNLDRTTARLAEVEARNEQLRLELAQAASRAQSQPTASVEEDADYMRLRSENSNLRRKLDAAKLEKESEKGTLEGRLRSAERDAAHVKNDRDELHKKVQKWSDYDEVRRELEILKSIQFSTGDDDEPLSDADQELLEGPLKSPGLQNGTTSKDRAETLEQLLLARNQKLGDELTHLRVSHQDLQQRLQTLQDGLSKTTAELDQSRLLNATLENDLLKVQHETSQALPSSATSVAGTYTSRHPAASAIAGRRFRTSPTSSIISGFDPPSGSPASLDAIRSGEGVGAGSGILPMVTAQRDRFKQRNSQLEEELSKAYGTVTSLRQEVASLQKDNLSLYEKSRYVSSFSRNGNAMATSSSAYPASAYPPAASIQASSSTPSGLSLDRYRSAYEAQISPFAAFRGRESVRAYKRMSLPERAIFSVTRMVLATRTSRNLFAAYCLVLHLMVFSMLYWMGTVDIERHTSKLGEATVAAAVAASKAKKAGSKEWHQEGFSGGG
ncbi:MAG: hypothetical protein M1826_002000 [Phylliscum demangeonii]|nr:MAG: hypothetical protein M1826_002000 [Phylliscum demangeonii]